ncbi:MAG: type III-B CRISPR-associated protein Cas10/Cmr2 [Saprospiraceae bacterium]|nr:type III-B CRISPR-associated protein Cas10/Cmr2 [Saprospiraceae bacterium]
MKHLILFTIGPVQSFIAQARKTQDLYAGSSLLSALVRKAIEVIGEKHLIFPKKGESMPNRFLAEVPETETTALKAFGQRIENVVRNEWHRIAGESLKGINSKPKGFDEQIANHLEIFWVIDSEGDDYASTISNLEKQLAGIKNVRPFRQFRWQEGIVGERGRKCNLDGQRNVQFYQSRSNSPINLEGSPLYTTPGAVDPKQKYQENVLARGEGLSAVSFLKRHYETNTFKSTAEIALLDALNSLEKDTVGRIYLKEYKSQIFNEFNAQLLYKNGLSERSLDDPGMTFKNGYTLEKAIQKRDALERKSGLKFQKYYAVFTFDGDDMGKWLSGEFLKDKKQLNVFQIQLAQCLSEFSKAARQRLDEGSGQTIYAGGDDFIGFLNLNHLLHVMKDIRILFREKVDIPLSGFKTKEISFSMGICVAHYKEPLTLVLQEARNSQKKAKDLDEKNAFAISVVKGSGESHRTALPFGANEKNIERLSTLTNALIQEDFSNNFIKTLRLEFERVLDFQDDPAAFQEVFKCELKRLLHRAANKHWSKERKKQESEKMTDLMMPLFGFRQTENFFQVLHISDFFQRELDVPQKQNKETTQTT